MRHMHCETHLCIFSHQRGLEILHRDQASQNHGHPIKGPPLASRTSRQYCAEVFKEGCQLGSHYACREVWACRTADYKSFSMDLAKKILQCGCRLREINFHFLSNVMESDCGIPGDWGPVTITDMHTPPPPLRSSHLDIKDAQWVEKMMWLKFHIISYRVWAPQAPKHNQTAPHKFNFLQKWPILHGRLELTCRSFFAQMIFFVWFLVFEV